jgi:hypothetical protein
MVAALIAVMPTEGTTIAVAPLDFQPARQAAVGRRQNDVAIAAWLRGDGAVMRAPILPL